MSNIFWKLLYLVVGVMAAVFGILAWCGIELNQFAAGSYAFVAGVMFVKEAMRIK